MAESDRLAKLSRPELIARATELGVARAERMTRLELADEILRLTKTGAEHVEARGLFGVARAMVADVMERGLNLPDAAALIRGTTHLGARMEPRVPVATVTLAEIYAAQGHRDRALRILDKVLLDEPEHALAQKLRADLLRNGSLALGAEDPAGVPVSLDYEPNVEWETTGEKVKTDAPPAVAALPEVLAEPMAKAAPLAESAEPRASTPGYASLELSWSGQLLLLDWVMALPESRDYCVEVVGFETTDGRPLRHTARFPIGHGPGPLSGQIGCPGWYGSSVCAALGFLDGPDRFIPLTPGKMLRPAPKLVSSWEATLDAPAP